MLVKVFVYFLLESDKKAKIENVDLLKESIYKELEEHLSTSSYKLSGSWWNDNRIKAKFVTSEEALETLRTMK